MSHCTRCWLSGLALILGGLLTAVAHLYHIEPPSDPAQWAQYARLSQPLHLVLFSGGTLVLLGWFGQYGLHSSRTGAAGLLAFFLVFLGILLADLLHCVLEFSVFPVLGSSVPYALPALAAATYTSTPFAFLLQAGQWVITAGTGMQVYSIFRKRVLSLWIAIPFAVTAALFGWTMLAGSPNAVRSVSYVALYISLAILGLAVITTERSERCNSSEQLVQQ